MLIKITGKLAVCAILGIGAAACFKQDSSNRAQSENVSAVNATVNTENAKRLDGQSATVIPPSPDTLTAALLRNRQDKIEPVAVSEVFKKDDGVRLKISAVESGFVTVLYRGSGGKYLKLFPSQTLNQGKNSILPNQILEIPDRGWLFFDDKKGVETIFVVYSKTATPKNLSGDAKESIVFLEKFQSENKNADVYPTDDGSLVRVIKLTHE